MELPQTADQFFIRYHAFAHKPNADTKRLLQAEKLLELALEKYPERTPRLLAMLSPIKTGLLKYAKNYIQKPDDFETQVAESLI